MSSCFRRYKKKCLLKISNYKETRKTKKLQTAVSKGLGYCGNNLQVFGNVNISFSEKISIGNDCKLNDKVYLNARSGITIGNDVTLSYDAKIISAGYKIEDWIAGNDKQHFDDKPIIIGNHCWIGAGAIILPGVNITGEYVVVGAGSVVTKDITESRVIVAGNPAKIVKRLGE